MSGLKWWGYAVVNPERIVLKVLSFRKLLVFYGENGGPSQT